MLHDKPCGAGGMRIYHVDGIQGRYGANFGLSGIFADMDRLILVLDIFHTARAGEDKRRASMADRQGTGHIAQFAEQPSQYGTDGFLDIYLHFQRSRRNRELFYVKKLSFDKC